MRVFLSFALPCDVAEEGARRDVGGSCLWSAYDRRGSIVYGLRCFTRLRRAVVLQDENMQKWAYACEQLARDWTPAEDEIHPDIVEVASLFVCVFLHNLSCEAYRWQARLSADEVIKRREEMMCALEHAGDKLRANGLSDAWMQGCDKELQRLCEPVNGPLLEQLGKMVGADLADVHIFRTGEPIHADVA